MRYANEAHEERPLFPRQRPGVHSSNRVQLIHRQRHRQHLRYPQRFISENLAASHCNPSPAGGNLHRASLPPPSFNSIQFQLQLKNKNEMKSYINLLF